MLEMMVAARWLPFLLERLLLGGVGAVGAHAELGVVHDRGQDVVELVGDAGGEGADAAEALGTQELFAQLFGFRCDRQGFFADHAMPPPRAEWGAGSSAAVEVV
jgi:hypothetical protein